MTAILYNEIQNVLMGDIKMALPTAALSIYQSIKENREDDS